MSGDNHNQADTPDLASALIAQLRHLRAEREDCGHPNHGAVDHDCAPFLAEDES